MGMVYNSTRKTEKQEKWSTKAVLVSGESCKERKNQINEHWIESDRVISALYHINPFTATQNTGFSCRLNHNALSGGF